MASEVSWLRRAAHFESFNPERHVSLPLVVDVLSVVHLKRGREAADDEGRRCDADDYVAERSLQVRSACAGEARCQASQL